MTETAKLISKDKYIGTNNYKIIMDTVVNVPWCVIITLLLSGSHKHLNTKT